MLQVYIGIAAVVAGLGLTGGFYAGSKFKQGEWDASVLAKKAGEDAALKAAAEAISKIEVKSVKYVQPVRTEIRTNTVYLDCAHSADSLRNLNALITGGDAGPGEGGVPPAVSAP